MRRVYIAKAAEKEGFAALSGTFCKFTPQIDKSSPIMGHGDDGK
jgi:hypothetical protein